MSLLPCCNDNLVHAEHFSNEDDRLHVPLHKTCQKASKQQSSWKRLNKRAQTYSMFLRASWACSLSLTHGQSHPRCRGEEAEQESPDIFHVPQSFLGLFVVTDAWTVTAKMSGRRGLTREPRHIPCSSELLGPVHCH